MTEAHIIVINHTVGSDSDATATTPLAVFLDKKDAEEHIPVISKTIKWSDYYEGELEVITVPLNPKSI